MDVEWKGGGGTPPPSPIKAKTKNNIHSFWIKATIAKGSFHRNLNISKVDHSIYIIGLLIWTKR